VSARTVAVIVGLALGCAPVGALAQSAGPATGHGRLSASAEATTVPPGRLSPARVAALRNRYHVRQMESVLERAIEHAAQLMTHRLQTVSPDIMALAGSPRAQGFRLEGYGLFFAVEVPRLSDSMNWALRVLGERHDERTLASLRRLADAQTDPSLRADIERAMRLVELQAAGRWSVADRGDALEVAVTPPQAAPPAPPPATVPPSADTAAGAGLADVLADPSAAYEEEVRAALLGALLDYSLSLPVAPGEWVTVAARDAGFVAFPDAVAEMVTVTLSVRVDDLLAYRAQRIDRGEALRRVVVREF
jgi:hypothetical protein